MEIEQKLCFHNFVELLKNGESFTVNNIRIGTVNDHLFVTGWTSYSSISQMSKSIALEELETIKLKFMKLKIESFELSQFFLNKPIKYNLALNYGMGSFGICSEENGKIEWLVDLSNY